MGMVLRLFLIVAVALAGLPGVSAPAQFLGGGPVSTPQANGNVKAQACAAIGTYNAQFYRHYGASPNSIFLAPYTVNTDLFTQAYERYRNQRRQIKKELGIVPDLPVVLYCGRLLKGKRVMDLVQAFESASVQARAALAIVGDGEEKDNLQAYVTSHNLENISLLGFRNQQEIARLYAIADVFVLPSERELWGLVINEAMCYSMPIIASDKVGAVGDLVRSGVNGYIYPAGDVSALAEHLRELLSNSQLREVMGAHSREIISKWDYAAAVRGFLQALAHVTQGTV